MQQEGKDKVPVDVMTEHRVGVHETHVSTEVCHTAQSKKKERNYMKRTLQCVCVCEMKITPPEACGLTWFGKLGR